MEEEPRADEDVFDEEELRAFEDHRPLDKHDLIAIHDEQRAEHRAPWTDADLQAEARRRRSVGRRIRDQDDRNVWTGFGRGTAQHALLPTRWQSSVMRTCNAETRLIRVDLCRQRHFLPGAVRGTFLHELCHAAAGADGHGPEFFAEVTRLTELGVRVPFNGSHLAASRRKQPC